jgi:hypothetical protein
MEVSDLVQGTYVFQLKVTDNSGVTATATVSVTVNPALTTHQPPVANAGPNQSLTLPVSMVTLDGSASYDTDGTIVSYQWFQVSGLGGSTIVNETSSVATLYGLKAGVYVFELIVTDNEGATGSATVTITINPASATQDGPVAVAGSDTTIGYPATGFVLNGSGSYDASGTIETYSWKEVSGPTNALSSSSQGVTTVASDLETGDYVFQLTVTDNNGQSDSSTVDIKVISTQRAEPSLTIYPNPTIGEQVTIAGTSAGKGNMYVSLLDVSGKMLMKTVYVLEGSGFTETLPLPSVARGVYLVCIQFDGQAKPTIFKLVKQ